MPAILHSLSRHLLLGAALLLPVVALAQANPPTLTANVGLTGPNAVTQLQEKIITSALLNATDLDTNGLPADPADIEFVMDSRDPVTFSGTLRLYNTPGGRVVQPGEAITLEDINDGLLRYRADIGDQLFDNILFQLRDIDGNYVRDPVTGMAVTFNFPISIIQLNTAPAAINGSATIGIGAVYEGTLSAVDNDRPAQALTFSIVDAPASGTIELLSSAPGAFRYTAAPGVEGPVSFTFQVSDGTLSSATAGVFTLTMQNQSPLANRASFSIPQNRPFFGALAASDPDLPAQPLTFSVSSLPEKGTLALSPDGTFRYTPAPGRFGEDVFRVTVSDGRLTTAPIQVALEIDHQPVAGDLFIATKSTNNGGSGSRTAMIVSIDPDQFDLALTSAGELLTSIRVLAYSRWSQKFYVVEGDPGSPASIVEIDPLAGTQRVAFSGEMLQFPLGLAASDDGYLYVANAPLVLGEPVDQSGPGSQVLRLDLRTGEHTVVLEDGPLHFPTGLALGNDGALYIADAETFGLGNPQGPADATILRLDLMTNNVTTFAAGALLQDPISLLPQSDDSLLVAELRGDVIKIDALGNLSHIYDAVDGQRGVTGLTRDENGTVYATAFDIMEGGASPAILRVLNPESATPTTEVFLEGSFLGEPFGIAAVTEHPSLAAWQAGHFSAADRANPALEATVWGEQADPDGDGLSNLLEFALNLIPTKSDAGSGVLAPFLRSDGGTARLALAISRRTDAAGLTYTLEASEDLVNWTVIGGPAATSASGSTATFEDNTALDSTTRRFIRLSVSRP